MITPLEEIMFQQQRRVMAMYRPLPPIQISQQIIDFSKQLNGVPIWLKVQPRAAGPLHECFKHVAKHVEENGGTIQLGWTIWELPTVFLEAEMHAVWKSPEGQLLDVTPKRDNEQRLLFVPDPSLVHDATKRVDSKRLALKLDKCVIDFIAAAERRHKLLGESVGPFEPSRDLYENEVKMGLAQVQMLSIAPQQLVNEAKRLSILPPS